MLEDFGLGSWDELKEAVEVRFGLSPQRVLEAFKAMRPAQGEREEEFVVRVED